jgi:hypothetical protein
MIISLEYIMGKNIFKISFRFNDLSKWNGIRTVYKALPEDPKDSPIITFTKDKFLTPLKAENEPATHKLVDTLGDLALVGYRIYGDMEIYVPGHKFTHKIAKEIRGHIQSKDLSN